MAVDEVMPGYKRTEVGVIPQDWEVTSIGASEPLVTSGPRGWAKHYSSQGSPMIRITNLSRKSIRLDVRNLRYVTVPTLSAEGTRTSLQDGDVLLSITADIGIVGFISSDLQKPSFVNQHIALVRFSDSKIDSRFIAYYLASEASQAVFREITDAGAKAGINLPTVRALPLILPATKQEQQAISNCIAETQFLIEKLENILVKKRDLKQAAMQELLRPKVDWRSTRLGDVLTIKHGRSQTAVQSSAGSIPILASGGQIGWSTHYLYDKPSVLIGRKGTIDKPRYVDQPFWTVDTLFYSEIFPNHSAKYLYYQFCLIPWRDHNEGSGVPSLNASTIENIEICIPALEEQKRFAVILTDMDAEITALEARLAKYRDIHQGMMQQLLTGAIRLI